MKHDYDNDDAMYKHRHRYNVYINRCKHTYMKHIHTCIFSVILKNGFIIIYLTLMLNDKLALTF